MKNTLKLILGLVLLASIFLSACAPPPPPITKDQLDQSDTEAFEAEENANELKIEKDGLEEELKLKKAELESLKEYQQELEIEE
jgi:outer membrane murein-binding lipoprotein Lpp